MTIYSSSYLSPLGPLVVETGETGLTRVEFVDGLPGVRQGHPLLDQCLTELAEYFAGQRRQFSVLAAPAGTDFQRRVWAALREVPYGRTTSYQDLAAHLGDPRLARAVGAAVARNRLAIIVPCHRVVGKDDALRGFAWGTWRKERLLAHEQ